MFGNFNFSDPKQYRVGWNQSRDVLAKRYLGRQGNGATLLGMQSHVITWKGFSYLFKFLSSFFLILGHSGELKNVTRVYNGKPDSLHQSSFEYGWSIGN